MSDRRPCPPRKRLGAVAFVWLGRSLAGALIALPVALTVSAPLAGFPAGDRLLFQPGATYLTEVLRLSVVELAAALRTSGWLLLVLGFAQLIPLGALLTALTRTEPLGPTNLLVHGVRHLATFSLMSGVTVLVQAVLFVVAGIPALGLSSALRPALGPAAADLTALATAAVILWVVAFVGAVQDLARAAVVWADCSATAAFAAAVHSVSRRPLRIAIDWTLRWLAGAALLAAAATLTITLGLEREGAAHLAAITLVQQGAVLAAVYLRADWLFCAVLHVSSPSPQSLACKVADSDERDDPSPSPES